MTTNGNIQPSLSAKKSVHVAVAVLRYAHADGELLLLATRHAHQHQGGKLEFVGGKIEANETAVEALVREVNEELGLDIKDNIVTKMGRIWHDYVDKSVCLHVYQTWLNNAQYIDFKDKKFGLDGQVIAFYAKDEVLKKKGEFPEANAIIIDWLSLPKCLVVSHELEVFAGANKKTDWLDCYKKLPKNSTLLFRPKSDDDSKATLLAELIKQRADLALVVSCHDLPHAKQAWAVRLTHDELLAQGLDVLSLQKLPDLPIIASCHDEISIHKVNALAKVHPVLAVLLSPVLPTATHPNSPNLGWQAFAKLSALSDVPVIALGGLKPSDLGVAYQHGAVAVAGVREFL